MCVFIEHLALNSLGLDANNNALIVQSDDVVLATGATMSDTEYLNSTTSA
jgi:archaeosine-15-forming tRNA-guanine transglycosylase